MVRKKFTQMYSTGLKVKPGSRKRITRSTLTFTFPLAACLRYHLFPTKACATFFTLNVSTNSYVPRRFFALEAEHSYLLRDLIG